MPLDEFNSRIIGDAQMRQELTGYVSKLVDALHPISTQGLSIRLTIMLEDNMNVTAAQSLHDLVRDAGWPGQIGRNPCPGCTQKFPPDAARVGDYWEHHVNIDQQILPWAQRT